MSELMLPVASIFQNRLNANEMPVDKLVQLKVDVEAGDYDAITVSPLDVFYDAEARMDPRVASVIPADADPKSTYVICDGYHRHLVASQLGLANIHATVKHMTESDAMAHFYRRHKLRGEMDPIKEAELFQHELEKRGVVPSDLVKIYNLSNVSYIKTRLALLNVTMNVVDLFYMPPPEFPGKLTTEHLKSISYLPKKMQFAVAMMSLERNWRIEDIRVESKRLRAGLGLRPTEGVEEPPGSNPTLIQRHLHPNIDRLLKPNEEMVVRAVKKMGEGTAKEIMKSVGFALRTTILKTLTEMEVLVHRDKERTGSGRRTQIYQLWVAEEQPKSEYVRKVALTDEELLEQYPDAFKQEPEEEPVTVREKAKREKKEKSEPIRVIREGEERIKPIGPEDWRRTMVDEALPPPVVREPVVRPAPLPPLVLNQDLIEDFSEAVYELAIKEGLDLRDRGLDDALALDLEKALYKLRDASSPSSLALMGLKICQLYTRATHKRTER
ncbi:hypothetical protein LCGC14_2302890 [marine sediment metagenome]|uniref:ParB/Sulfiredoxin domain-containing protein n=1 Tax=marine sediment metagenome TaxID=412755 RepID=A0A0F9FHU3_9ZZZZ